jgi:hypothetical protein
MDAAIHLLLNLFRGHEKQALSIDATEEGKILAIFPPFNFSGEIESV